LQDPNPISTFEENSKLMLSYLPGSPDLSSAGPDANLRLSMAPRSRKERGIPVRQFFGGRLDNLNECEAVSKPHIQVIP